jgi:hypothetical protein
MKKWVWLPLLLAGCVSVKPLRMPDGSQGYSINCRPGGHEWASCMDKAAELCGKYTIVSQNIQTNGQAEMIVACH